MKVASIRLYATSSLYYLVNIWSSKKELRKHCWWVSLERDALGVCSTQDVYSSTGRKKKCMGEINLLKRHLTTEILVHEVTHAAFGYSRRLKLDFSKDSRQKLSLTSAEERFCYAVGSMVRQLVNRLFKLKLLY